MLLIFCVKLCITNCAIRRFHASSKLPCRINSTKKFFISKLIQHDTCCFVVMVKRQEFCGWHASCKFLSWDFLLSQFSRYVLWSVLVISEKRWKTSILQAYGHPIERKWPCLHRSREWMTTTGYYTILFSCDVTLLKCISIIICFLKRKYEKKTPERIKLVYFRSSILKKNK